MADYGRFVNNRGFLRKLRRVQNAQPPQSALVAGRGKLGEGSIGGGAAHQPKVPLHDFPEGILVVPGAEV